jgi:DNA-binding response OmpR family regulator
VTQLLVVDDDEEFAGAIRMVLQSRGFDVAMEYDPAKALQRIEQRQPDAVILDVMFPEDPVAGVELARTVRNQFPTLPILMLTAICQQMPLEFSSRDIDPSLLPVTEFLEKPIDFGLLCDKLDRLLNRPTIATEENE